MLRTEQYRAQNREVKPSVDSSTSLFHPLIPRELYRFIDTRPEFFPQQLQTIYDEILANPSEINGLDNPMYQQAVDIDTLNSEFFLEQIRRNNKYRINERDKDFTQKQAAIAQYEADAQKLVERIQGFEGAFRSTFEATALYHRDRPFTPGLIFDLRDFLVSWIPEDFPIWDCNPITQYSKEQQVMNFKQRTMQHIDCVMLYTYEYFTAWNAQVDTHARPDQDTSKLKVDVYFMMARALLHDLGRWFTQDTRAHEEIPASFAERYDEQGRIIKVGLRRDLLTLDDGDPSTHPRAFNLGKADGPMTLKKIVKTTEFTVDVFSKPHKDKVEEYYSGMLLRIKELSAEDDTGKPRKLSEVEARELSLLLEITTKYNFEKLRQSELRYPELGLFYMMYSGGGYQDIEVGQMQHWYEYLEERFDGNEEKLKYYVKEAQMLETSRVFLQQLGLSPAQMRLQVMAKWQLLDSDDKNFLEKCFPGLRDIVQAERAAALDQEFAFSVTQALLAA